MRVHSTLIIITTTILVAVALGVMVGLDYGTLMWFVLLGHISLVGMTVAILKAPFTTRKTFEEYFYQDEEIKRNNLRAQGKRTE